MSSEKGTARLAGLFWLLFVLLTAFSLGYARSNLIVAGDAEATIGRIASMEGLYRASIAASLISQMCMFLLGLALFRLFYRVSRIGATMLLASALVSVAVAVACSISSYAVLGLLGGADYLAPFSWEHIGALAMLFLRLGNSGQALLELFWAPFYISFGLLVIRSRLIPAALGVLLILMGAGYLINVLTKLLIPHFYPELITNLAMLLGALGGIPMILWLLVKGAKGYQLEAGPLRKAESAKPQP